MRVDKFLAEACIGTRKIVRGYVKEGKVTVNNKQIFQPEAEINEAIDVVRYLGKEILHKGKMYYMFNKPEGCITARKDDNRKTVLDYFDVDNLDGIFPVGRLDKDTEGLLFLTNDGEFNQRLMHPNKHVEKTYFFLALGSLNFEAEEQLKMGVDIGEGEALARAIKFEFKEASDYNNFYVKTNMESMKKKWKKHSYDPVVSGYITISEGRKHQVKRMLKAVECSVIYLKRISIGALKLDETLKKGEYRELTQQEIEMLYA